MEQNILKEWIVNMGKQQSSHRIEVMKNAIEKAKSTTDSTTASVVDDVIVLLDRINKDIEKNLF